MPASLALLAERPVPRPAEEERASEELLAEIERVVKALRAEAAGLARAREQYRRRIEGTRVRR